MGGEGGEEGRLNELGSAEGGGEHVLEDDLTRGGGI